MKYRILLAMALILALDSCKKESISPDTTTKDTSPANPAVVYNINVSVMLGLVNSVRQSGCNCGTTAMPPVATLTWNDKLAIAAYNHTKDMFTNNYFSHTNLQGLDPGKRITAAGYTWTTYGENIANGYTTEQAVMNAWLKSEGHCMNIMNKSFREMGAGREGNYWTQVFATGK